MKKHDLILIFLTLSLSVYCQDTLKVSGAHLSDLNISRNLNIRGNEEAYYLAKSKFSHSISSLLPTITIGYIGNSLHGYAQAIDGTYLDVNNTNQWKGQGAMISWDLGTILSNVLKTKNELDQTLLRNKLAHIEENISVYNLYFSLLGSLEKEKTLSQFISKSNEILKEIKIQVTSGIRLESDVLTAQLNLNRLKVTRLKQQNESNQYLLDLKLNLAYKNEEYISFDQDLFEVLASFSSVSILSYDISDRIDVMAEKKEWLAIKAQYNMSWIKNLIPELNLVYNSGMFGPYASSYLGESKRFGASISWNIPLSNLLPHGDASQQKQVLKIAEIKRDQMILAVQFEINSTIYAHENSQMQFNLASESRTLAKKAFEQALQRLSLGTSLQMELYYSEQTYLASQIELIDCVVNLCVLSYKKKVDLVDKFSTPIHY